MAEIAMIALTIAVISSFGYVVLTAA